MGIQSKKPKRKATTKRASHSGKNHVEINVTIEDKAPVKVVKPEVVKPRVIRVPVLPKTPPVAKRAAINIVETNKNRLFIITPIKSCPHNLQIK